MIVDYRTLSFFYAKKSLHSIIISVRYKLIMIKTFLIDLFKLLTLEACVYSQVSPC